MSALLRLVLLTLVMSACSPRLSEQEEPEQAEPKQTETERAEKKQVVTAIEDSARQASKPKEKHNSSVTPVNIEKVSPKLAEESSAKVSPKNQASDPNDTTLVSLGRRQARITESDRKRVIASLCTEIGNKLSSVSIQECQSFDHIFSALSSEKRALTHIDFTALDTRAPLGKVMVIGGIHGDEYSSVSVVFKWLAILRDNHSGLFEWRFIPSANPDGLLAKKSQRQNARGVDLNRNFPSQDWDELAQKYWVERAYKNPRRYPGETAASEVETQFVVKHIEAFNPDVVISIHAPYHLLDYDGPPYAPKRIGGLYLRQLGVFPGSLGNYFGVDKGKPIVTVELKSAGIMPSNEDISGMWVDLVRWLKKTLPAAATTSATSS